MPLSFDAQGRWQVPALLNGRPKVLESGFLDSATPTWLTTSGTITFTGEKHLAATTPASIGGTAQLTMPTILSSAVQAVHFELSAMRLTASTATIDLGFVGSGSAGINVTHTAGETSAKATSAGVTQLLDKVQITGPQAATYRNLGLIVIPGTRELYVLEGDDVLDYRKFAGMNGGNCSPYVKVTATTAAAVAVVIGRMRAAIY